MRALVTGSEGFIGRHMIEFLRKEGYEVWASVEEEEYARDMESDHFVKCDVRVMEEVNDAVGKSAPDVVYHLAAQSYPTVSWEQPQLTLETNTVGTANLFESILKHNLDPVVVVACSSAEYGFVTEDEVPVKETHRLEPLHPYGVSKVGQDLLTYQYFKNNGVKGVRARIFNTTGPGKVKDVVSDFAKRVAECEAGKRKTVTHGNLEAKRDITDVRDQVRALHACEKADYGDVYNLCSMKVHKIQDLLDQLVEMSGGEVSTEQDPALMRPTDEPIIMGDNSKLVKRTGYNPKIRIDQTLEDTLEHWRARV
ncbi:MAG: NAD-dependent epimerase/dehydratase family protein [Candidatus Altiarchaeales archaeon]|nr:NAD-dependent epimerase/dehydratase family protein [Candidatus Altiarchaeales archaeon]MBD3417077.1 NAD-dependent epimerase/dehydratase family protein [Candidatus Altiarchaeales archaeon]